MQTYRRRVAQIVRGRRTSGGFTLLEILVAIMVLTLVMSVAFSAVRLAGRSLEAGIEGTNSTETLRSVADFLRRRLAQMVAVSTSDESIPQFAFSGNRSRLRFVALAPRHPFAAGLLLYSVHMDADADAQRIVLTYAQYDPGSPDALEAVPSKQLTLATGVRTLSFEFFGTKANAPAPTWHDEWSTDEEGLPELVRMTWTGVTRARSWPELILNVRPETST